MSSNSGAVEAHVVPTGSVRHGVTYHGTNEMTLSLPPTEVPTYSSQTNPNTHPYHQVRTISTNHVNTLQVPSNTISHTQTFTPSIQMPHATIEHTAVALPIAPVIAMDPILPALPPIIPDTSIIIV